MNIKSIIRKISSPAPVIAVCTLLLFTLSFLIVSSLQEDSPGRLQYWITVVGGIGIALLLFFLLANAYVLIRQLLRNELGSRLTTKLVLIFLFLMFIPFSLIYYFSIQFLNKGVDSWFDVRIEQTVNDSILLSQTALEGIKEETIKDVEDFTRTLRQNVPASELLDTLEQFRELEDYTEVSLFTDDGRVLAFSNRDTTQIFPDTPGDEVFDELRLNQTYTLLEPISESTQQMRVVAPIPVRELGRQFYGLQVIKILPLRYAKLANSVETANNQYAQMVFARAPLKFSLVVTLSLISLASLLFSLVTAVYLSRRLVSPISNLAAGTKKIAEGDYGSQLPITSTDELGILTGSFNNMSRKIFEAQQTAAASQTETEDQKAYLEAVLTNLSSGVFSFNASNTLEICNSAASDILGIEQKHLLQKSVTSLKQLNTQTSVFFERIENGISSGKQSWQDEVTLLGQHGRQIVIIRGSVLGSGSVPGINTSSSHDNQFSDELKVTDNHVVVFDDVTNLIQAQRDAAWGEVARRLAHEIKNPLTPIQLSAERIKTKLEDEVAEPYKEMLERSTRTIVQQVESMKDMVNDFSSYAQPVRAKLAPMPVNQLVRDVIELHATVLQNIELEVNLADSLPSIKANAGALRQVLNNLVINACHALEGIDTPKLKVSSKQAESVNGQYVDIVIEDNGNGIPADIRESIFDPYVSSKAKGSGLGLAIVKRIVEEHGGSVWTHTGSLDGTAMQLRLPINAMQSYRGNRS